MTTENKIEIESEVNCSVQDAWKSWTSAEHIKHWNNASDEWHTPKVEIDVKEGGDFKYRMEAKDGSAGFDFTGTFKKVVENELLEYTLGNDRKVTVRFEEKGEGKSHLTQTFEAEKENDVEMQRTGWQSILQNFKNYTEENFG